MTDRNDKNSDFNVWTFIEIFIQNNCKSLQLIAYFNSIVTYHCIKHSFRDFKIFFVDKNQKNGTMSKVTDRNAKVTDRNYLTSIKSVL